MPVFNILICVLLITVFGVFFLPVEKLVKRALDINVDGVTASLVVLLMAVVAMVYTLGLAGILYLALSTFCLWIFIFGFLVDRKYPYTLALIFLVFCPFLLIAKLDKIAEFSAVLCYLCLVLGVLKDIFYDKIIHGIDAGGNDA